MNLSEKESKVFNLILGGIVIASAIVEQSELSTQSVNAIITSLIKKELIVKTEDGIGLTEKGKEFQTGPKNSSLATQDDVDVIQPDAITVLIPYFKSEAAGQELLYALRSWEENFQHPYRIVIVGDREDWFSPEIVHIPFGVTHILEDCNCAAPSQIRNPQADVTHKILAAIASGEVSGDFILSNDDIFLTSPITLADIQLRRAFGQLDNSAQSNSLYQENRRRTARALAENGYPTHNYGTHTPMLLNAEILAEVIEKYQAYEKGFLLTSLYFNERYAELLSSPIQITGRIEDPILASVYRADVDAELLARLFQERKFINCNTAGWKCIVPQLAVSFPNPSKFEFEL